MKKVFSSLLLLVAFSIHSWAALTDNLISYWALDEASGNRADKVVASANTLAQFGSPGNTTGKVYATAANLVGASSQEFFLADNASLSTGDIDYTVAGWFNSTNITVFQGCISKYLSTGNQREYLLRLNSSKFEFLVSSNGTATTTVTDVTTLSNNTWYFVVAWHDSVNNFIKICVNNGTVTSTATSAGSFDSTSRIAIGEYDNGSQYFTGIVGPCMFWKRVLTSGEITQIYNGGNGLTYAAMVTPIVLSSNLTSYWPLNEASGNAADAVVASANTLTDNATVTSNPGRVYATARQFTAANSEFFNRADSSSVSTGNIDFTIGAWVFLTSKAARRPIISKWNGATNQREYVLAYDTASDRFQFLVSNDGTATQQLLANTFGSPALSTWYFVLAYHNAAGDLLGISVNNGTVDTQAWASGVFDSTQELRIGSDLSPTATYWDGQIGPVMFWKRLLSAGDITQVYNNGAGLTYEGILGTGIIMHPLISGTSTTNATSYATASVTVHANRLAVLSYQNARDAGLSGGTPTVTSTGATWHEFKLPGHINYHTNASPTRNLTLFYTMVSSDQTSTLTIDHSAGNTQDGAAWSLVEFEGVPTGGTDGSGAIGVVSGASGGSGSTTVVCNLNPFGDVVNNVTFGAFGKSGVAAFVPGSGFTGIHDVNYATPSNELFTELRTGQDSSVDATWTGAVDCGCVAAEIIRSGSTGGGPSPALLSAIQALQDAEDDDLSN